MKRREATAQITPCIKQYQIWRLAATTAILFCFVFSPKGHAMIGKATIEDLEELVQVSDFVVVGIALSPVKFTIKEILFARGKVPFSKGENIAAKPAGLRQHRQELGPNQISGRKGPLDLTYTAGLTDKQIAGAKEVVVFLSLGGDGKDLELAAHHAVVAISERPRIVSAIATAPAPGVPYKKKSSSLPSGGKVGN